MLCEGGGVRGGGAHKVTPKGEKGKGEGGACMQNGKMRMINCHRGQVKGGRELLLLAQ